MFNHEPKEYKCPFCAIINGIEGDFPYTKQDDIIYSDDYIIAFIASHWWPNNPGHVIIIPKSHNENLYDMPSDLLHRVHDFSKYISIGFKAQYKCDGVSIRQHNESEGEQDVWHYHLHVFPRYKNDNLYKTDLSLSDPKDRKQYSQLFKEYVKNNPYTFE